MTFLGTEQCAEIAEVAAGEEVRGSAVAGDGSTARAELIWWEQVDDRQGADQGKRQLIERQLVAARREVEGLDTKVVLQVVKRRDTAVIGGSCARLSRCECRFDVFDGTDDSRGDVEV